MADKLFEDGKLITVDGVELVCVSVSYQETDGNRYNYVYAFRPKADLDAERETSSNAELPLEADQPEENKEETINVR